MKLLDYDYLQKLENRYIDIIIDNSGNIKLNLNGESLNLGKVDYYSYIDTFDVFVNIRDFL